MEVRVWESKLASWESNFGFKICMRSLLNVAFQLFLVQCSNQEIGLEITLEITLEIKKSHYKSTEIRLEINRNQIRNQEIKFEIA